MKRWTAIAALCWIGWTTVLAQDPAPPAAETPRKKVTIAVVRDGPSWYSDEQADLIARELDLLVRNEFEVQFTDPSSFNANWQVADIPAVLQRALADPAVDVVLVMGLLATDTAQALPDPLPKPVLSGFVQDSDTLGLPVDSDGRSTKPGFSFVVTPLRATRDLEQFHQMVPAKTIDILIDSNLQHHLRNMETVTRNFEKRIGVSLRFLPVGDNAEQTLAGIGDDVKALYVTPPLRMSRAEFQKLIQGINARHIPSFSMMGHRDVEAGVLAGLAPDSRQRLARRAALNLQQILLGAAPTSLPVFLPIDEKLVINGRTAVAIGFSPDFETQLRAEMLHADAFETGLPLLLEQAMTLASSNSIDVAVKSAEVESSRQDRNLAGSALWPQVHARGRYTRIDDDRSAASFGSQPEERTAVGAEVSQVLVDDAVWTSRRSANRAFERQQTEAEAVRLDAMAEAGRRFLDLLSARAVHRIDLDNLRLTDSNLELARLRFKVGTAGPEEVYRWEAQEARQRSSAISSESAVMTALCALDQAMGVDQSVVWAVREIELADTDFYFLGKRLQNVVNNERELKVLREFSVEEGLRNSPSLRALDLAIQIQGYALAQLRRKGFLPTLSAGFTYDHVVDQTFAGAALADSTDGSGVPLLSSAVDDNEWIFSLTASLPLFEGGGRLAQVGQARAELDQLVQSRERTRQQTEVRTRTALYAAQSSQPNIRLSRVAADRARKNLEVIRDKYAGGSVSILDLLDAQNQDQVEAQTAARAVHRYLKDLVEYQRAISWFEVDHTEQEKDRWIERFMSFPRPVAPAAP